jgi:ABC-type Na+ efflux pump permease subunit
MFNVNQKMLYNPRMKSAYNFVPAIMGMLLMLICAMMTSISIVREKERGTMEVLLVSPVRPLLIIVAKAVPYLILAFLILISILLMARYVLGLESGGTGLPIEGVEISFGSLRPMTHEKVSEPTWNSGGDPLTIAEQEFQMKRSYREPQQDEHQLGYYWTTVQHDERSAFALTFAVGVHAHILPLDRLTRCSVRLVQDEVQQQPKSKKGRR